MSTDRPLSDHEKRDRTRAALIKLVGQEAELKNFAVVRALTGFLEDARTDSYVLLHDMLTNSGENPA